VEDTTIGVWGFDCICKSLLPTK